MILLYPLGSCWTPIQTLINNNVLSISKLTNKQKPLSVWDAMALFDVENYKKKITKNEINRKQNQRQLKEYYDKQVQDKLKKDNYERQKARKDYADIMTECKSIDNLEYNKIKQNKSLLKDVASINTLSAFNRKFSEDKERRQKLLDRAKIQSQLDHFKKLNYQNQNIAKMSLLKNAEEVKAQREKERKRKELEKQAKLIEEQKAIESNIQHFDKMEQRYRHIFEVIGKQQSDIQNHYK